MFRESRTVTIDFISPTKAKSNGKKMTDTRPGVSNICLKDLHFPLKFWS